MRTRTVRIAVLATALVAGACGRLNRGTGPADGGSTGGIEHPVGAGEVIVRIERVGGFVPVEHTLGAVPTMSLMGDGRLIVEGPMIEIYPGPALPNLLQSRVTEEGIQAILERARAAGLLGPDASYGYPCVADAATTRFTVVAEGRTHTISAYALELGTDPALETDCPGVDAEARAALLGFETKMGGLRDWLPEGSVGAEESYVPSEARVYVRPYREEPELPQAAIAWPLRDRPLDGFGDAVENLEETRCGVVAGHDLAAVLARARSANQLTPWTDDGGEFSLILRPLLPDEHTC